NTGIGLETAKALAKQGAKIILACRDENRGKNAELLVNQIREKSAHFMKLDLSDLSQIRLFVNEFKQKYDRLDVLLNNAGLMSPSERLLTKDGFEIQFGTNHLGHFLLTNLLLDLLKKTQNSRVVNVSSMAHFNKFPCYSKIHLDDYNFEKKYCMYQTYGQSKLANVLFTKQLQRIFDKENLKIKAVCLHPGVVRTELFRYYNKGYMNYINSLVYPLINFFLKVLYKALKLIFIVLLRILINYKQVSIILTVKLKKVLKKATMKILLRNYGIYLLSWLNFEIFYII
ncbi:short chain dehydrogenase reductase family protein, putative, partial [Ichthyophthirius multifiliis]